MVGHKAPATYSLLQYNTLNRKWCLVMRFFLVEVGHPSFPFLCRMHISQIKTIAVCGAGTMGSGIARAAAQSGYRVVLFDVNGAMLPKSRAMVENSLGFLVSKGKLSSAEMEQTLERLRFTSEISECRADVVMEAVVETPVAKAGLFNQLAQINSPETIFASNTSSLSITQLQQMAPLPQRFAGMHFFNPANIMKLVEVVKGQHTSQQTLDTLFDLAKKMGKVPVHCKDAPGFIVNHVARTYYLEAMCLLDKGIAPIETIDEIMEATGFKMGPFKLMDLIGMDINYKVSEQVWEALGKPDRLKPAAIQRAMVEAGELGKKTGRGFYSYS